jgi:hypothetical protein
MTQMTQQKQFSIPPAVITLNRNRLGLLLAQQSSNIQKETVEGQ